MDTALKLEQRCVIKFCANSKMTPTDTLKFIRQANAHSKVSRSLVFEWHKKFREGLDDVFDKPRSGRPCRSEEDVQRVQDIVNEDRRRSVREISDMTGICVNVVYRILTDTLKMNKVCARWVPRLLSDEQKETRVINSRSFLDRYEREGDQFLHRIVTMDETWMYLYEPESKQQSMVWKHTDSPPPKKARTTKSAGKFMFMFFMDAQGLILQHAVPAGTTVNASYYQKVIRRDLALALRRKRPNVEIENVVYHHDNAPAHRAIDTIQTIDFLGMERIPHAPYSPDLAPMDFALFPRLKGDLRGKRFANLTDLRMEVRRVVGAYEKDWYSDVFFKWVHRHRKCIACAGEYFEKM